MVHQDPLPLQLDYKRHGIEFLARVRSYVRKNNLNVNRLPKWTQAAHLQIGNMQGSTLLLIDNSPSSDDQITYANTDYDTQMIFDLEHQMPSAWYIEPARRGTGNISIRGEVSDEGRARYIISDTKTCIHQYWLRPIPSFWHVPIAVADMAFILEEDGVVQQTRLVPYLLYLDDVYFTRDYLYDRMVENTCDYLTNIHNSSLGDYHQKHKDRHEKVVAMSDKSVVVLGGYETDTNPNTIAKSLKDELKQVQDFIDAQGYDTNLIEDMAATPHTSMRHKVVIWTAASRFCIMVDRESSGHNNEFELLRSIGVTTAILRPDEVGASFMMSMEPEEVNFMKVFEFDVSPLEVLADAIEWAEESVETDTERYREYPWRERS